MIMLNCRIDIRFDGGINSKIYELALSMIFITQFNESRNPRKWINFWWKLIVNIFNKAAGNSDRGKEANKIRETRS